MLETFAAPVVIIAGYVLAPLDSRPWLGVTVSLAALIATVPLLMRRARAVRLSHTPALDALRAIAMFTSVLIVAFASLHYAVAVNVAGQYSGLNTKIDGVYYTVTVLGTVGFGDVTADGQLARVLATVNILFNLVALGVGLRLITFAAQTRFNERGTRLVAPPSDEA